MGKRRKIMEVERRQPLMKGLLPAQGFYATRIPPRIEFPFFNSESGRKTHQGGAKESAEESETDKEQQAPEPKAKQIREFFGLDHFSSAQKRFARSVPDYGADSSLE